MALEKNTEYNISITGTSSDGRGVGHIGGMTVFVSGAVERDTGRVLITRVKKRFAEGTLTEITAPSPHRIVPECPHFGICGGCQTANTDYSFELKSKANSASQAMRRIGGFTDFKFNKVNGGRSSRYRNKAVYKIDCTKEPICGFYLKKSHDIIPIGDCLLCDPRDSLIKAAVMKYISESGFIGIKQLFIRRGAKTGQTMAALDVSKHPPRTERLAQLIASADENVASVILNFPDGVSETLFGRDFIEDELLGIRFRISCRSFFQVNPEMTERLYSQALEYASLTGNERVLDIYCGIGTISLCSAKSAKHVTGVEIVPEAVENARENARINNIDNAVFYAESAESIVPKLIKAGERPDVVILDPPRKGSDAATLAAILDAAPKRIVYVSCDPATLARDAKILAEGGYDITAAQAFDMFPRTAHVECAVLMSRKDK